MKVVIVESPTKVKTIGKYLGKDYDVYASFGHVRDLEPKDGSVDTEHDFAMRWEVDAKAAKRLNEIANAVKGADRVILATDPDREGEAISWHVYEILKGKKVLKDKRVDRVVFNAVTKDAVAEAMRHPREIDEALVDAYLARRALDFLVGFNLSPVLWRKLPGARSAGRVQSVALRIVCDRELEIEKFVAREYWSILAHLETKAGASFSARLVGADGKKINRLDVGSGAEAEAFKSALETAAFSVAEVESKPLKRHPYPPFTTSTLQQEASRKLGLAPARTMQIAQRLYEGVDVGDGAAGLITYMRTDGVDLAPEAITGARKVIAKDFGDQYVPGVPRKYTVKAKNAQEAHEAIRPTNMTLRPREAARHLEPDQAKLYELIWNRTLASQMESAELERTTVDIVAQAGARQLDFRATGQVVRFPGFLALYQEGRDDDSDEDSARLPAMAAGEPLKRERIEASQHFTEPPPRYTEATLVKRMEELGIGRPSTYASTLAVLRDRDYVRIEKKRLVPEDRGRMVTAFLEILLPALKYVGYDFTAGLEEKLDQRLQQRDRLERAAARVLDRLLRRARRHQGAAHHAGARQPQRDARARMSFPARADGGDPRQCPSCGKGQLSLKLGKFGAFIGCSNYPECRFTRVLSPTGQDGAEGERPGVRALGVDPASGEPVTLRSGRFGDYVQLGEAKEGEKPKRCSACRKGTEAPTTVDAGKGDRPAVAAARDRASHPRSGRADRRRHRPLRLLCATRPRPLRQSRSRRQRLGDRRQSRHRPDRRQGSPRVASRKGRFGADGGRALGDHPTLGGAITAQARPLRRPYVTNHGKVNATLPQGTVDSRAAVTLDQQRWPCSPRAPPAAPAAAGWATIPRAARSPSAPAASAPMSRWGKIQRNNPQIDARRKTVTLSEALELLAERGDVPAKGGKARKPAGRKAAPAKAPGKKPAAKTPAESGGEDDSRQAGGRKEAPAKKPAAASKPQSKATAAKGKRRA